MINEDNFFESSVKKQVVSHSLGIISQDIIKSLIISVFKITLSKILGHETNEQIQRRNVVILPRRL